MKLSKPQSLVLFLLGLFYSEYEKRFAGKPFKPFLNKVDFISFVRSAGLINKGVRALYKNLEFLEKNKLISYKGKSLYFTPKGRKHFNSVYRTVSPFIDVSLEFKTKNILRFLKPVQAKFEK
ncbi:hypothetical protein DRJ22_01660 [Candidatus Woesearchaeota archaeon]|nr:MAG: hypothetical protein B6U93_02050 [Candidatus Woesearchaeota archaeon ex4484_78]RLE46559.1 MAG: hypothetical protein DRJ22_01660 [Candidatus Woesearchaeota archaeon]